MTIASFLVSTPAPSRVEVLPAAQETGAWSLDYLGPGFHVQVRIGRHGRVTELGGWMTPPRPGTVRLTSLSRDPVVLEADLGPSGRFEFSGVPQGPCRLIFVTSETRSPAMTPPFWI